VQDAADYGSDALLISVLEAWKPQAAQAAAETGVAAAQLYLSGIGIVNEGADWALVINDVLEGHYISLAAALPFVSRGLIAGTNKLVIRKGSGEVLEEFASASKLDAVKQVSFVDRDLHTMGITMEGAQFQEFLRKVLSGHGGKIPTPEFHGDLYKRMREAGPVPNWGKRPSKLCKDGKWRSYAVVRAHHDLPWQFKDWFARHGIDVNNPIFGRWVSDVDHHIWHNDLDPKFNDFWRKFIDDETKFIDDIGHPYTIQDILEKLAECRTQYPVVGAN
jgi:hypothetical protein